jgi:hypothetical protein
VRKLPAVKPLGARASSRRHQRRRANLERLLAEFGGWKALAAIVGTPDTHIHALRTGRRGLGDELAAKFPPEQRLRIAADGCSREQLWLSAAPRLRSSR